MDERTFTLLQELASQIGKTVEETVNFIWPILVRQVWIEGVVQIALYILLSIIILIYIMNIRSEKFKRMYNEFMSISATKSDGPVILIFLLGFLLLIAIVTFTTFLPEIIARLANPEFHALEIILNSVK